MKFNRIWNAARLGIVVNVIAISAFAFAASTARAGLRAGVGVADITPPEKSPSAGFGGRMGRPMKGVHDPLLATALVIDNGEKRLAFCGADHLGMLGDMIQEAAAKVHAEPGLENLEVFIGSSHTHAGGGGFLNAPGMGFVLAGKYRPELRQVYIDGVAKAIIQAAKSLEPALVGVGYGHAPGLNHYRSSWPPHVTTRDDLAVIKVTRPDGSPLAALVNYAAHPTVLSESNLLFSADYVGYLRDDLKKRLGGGQVVFFNGAQADITPAPPEAKGDEFARAEAMGAALAAVAKEAWTGAKASDALSIKTVQEAYPVVPQANSAGMKMPLNPDAGVPSTQINLIVLNGKDAFATIPGELSTIYDDEIKRWGGFMGFRQVSILGLTNDAHGYIITPEAWRHRTYESTVSFGGQTYGELVANKVRALLDFAAPDAGAPPEGGVIPSRVLGVGVGGE